MKMRKMVCAALVGACVLTAAGAADTTGSLPPQGARAYLDTIQHLQDTYGKGAVAGAGSPASGMWQGLSLARLIDFDGDGTPELYCAAGMAGQWLYTYDGGLKQLDIPQSVSNFSTDLAPSTMLYVGADKAYLVDGQEVMNGGTVTYFTKQGGEMTAALTYQDAIGEFPDSTYGAHICKLNGQTTTGEELQQALDAFTAGMAQQSYSFWSSSGIYGSVSGTVADTIGALRKLTDPQAAVSKDRIVLDGSPVQISVYKIGGNNYFKLRDIAYALSGTEAQFEVAWNGAQQRIDLTDGMPYTPVGGENSDILPVQEQASLTTASVWLGGAQLDLTAYQIAGNNFFKLRDLAAALDFGVTWEAETGTVQISSAASYTE